jgi:deoxyribodipyrimidine photo-lyase
VSQGERFDASGAYVRRWIPEIAALPDRHVHSPWTAPDDVLRESGVRLGQTYPRPIVDLRRTREAALRAYDDMKAAAGPTGD